MVPEPNVIVKVDFNKQGGGAGTLLGTDGYQVGT